MMKVYAIVDREAKEIVSIFTSLSNEAATRSFLMLLSSPERSLFTDFPEQFDLYPVCDLKYENGVSVTRQELEHVNAAGFRIDTFKSDEPIKAGSDYDKRYLKMVRFDRIEAFKKSEESEVSRETSSKEESNDE